MPGVGGKGGGVPKVGRSWIVKVRQRVLTAFEVSSIVLILALVL
jgi:hypothetical protein